MRSPAQAIVWEIAAKNRWALLFAFGLILFASFCEWITPPGHESIGALQGFSALATFVSLVWVCSYTANDSRGHFSGYPSWMYTLPLRTSALVLVPILLGIFLMLIAVVAWEITICVYWGRALEPTNIAWHALLVIATLVSTQCFIWSLHRFRWIRMVVLIAAMYGFLYVALVGPLWKFPGGKSLWFGAVALTIPLATAAAMAGVARDRRGDWQGWTGKLLEYLLDLIPRRKGAFVSTARAQLWIEWRRRGVFAVVAFGVTMALWVFTYPLSAALYLGPIETMFNFSGPFIGMVFIAGLIGNVLAKSDAWSTELALHPLVSVRPLRTSAVVFGKMKAAAIISVLGWVLFSILLVPVIVISNHTGWPSEQAPNFWRDFSENHPAFWRWLTNPIVMLALIAGTWHTIVQAMAVVLTGNKRRIMISTWQGMAVLGLIVGCALWLYRNPVWATEFMKWLPWLTTAMLALKIYGACRAFRDVRKLVLRRDFFMLLILWGIVAALTVTAGMAGHVAHGLPAALLWWLVLWPFFPAGEIPRCVIALAGNRHR